MGIGVNEIQIHQVRGYWEVRINGEFFCTADSYSEAVNELWSVYGDKL